VCVWGEAVCASVFVQSTAEIFAVGIMSEKTTTVLKRRGNGCISRSNVAAVNYSLSRKWREKWYTTVHILKENVTLKTK
jgi:hypothetical protein